AGLPPGQDRGGLMTAELTDEETPTYPALIADLIGRVLLHRAEETAAGRPISPTITVWLRVIPHGYPTQRLYIQTDSLHTGTGINGGTYEFWSHESFVARDKDGEEDLGGTDCGAVPGGGDLWAEVDSQLNWIGWHSVGDEVYTPPWADGGHGDNYDVAWTYAEQESS
ncbi:MAG: hypothetical protein ACXVHI_01045, partial [Frankiaceae bacterium]